MDDVSIGKYRLDEFKCETCGGLLTVTSYTVSDGARGSYFALDAAPCNGCMDRLYKKEDLAYCAASYLLDFIEKIGCLESLKYGMSTMPAEDQDIKDLILAWDDGR